LPHSNGAATARKNKFLLEIAASPCPEGVKIVFCPILSCIASIFLRAWLSSTFAGGDHKKTQLSEIAHVK
jgi:hypothetical protein